MVYILEFTGLLSGRAQFYVGWCADDGWQNRYQEHISGKGSKITQAAVRAGYSLLVAHTFPGGTRALEAYIKERKNTKKVLQLARSGKFKPTRVQMQHAQYMRQMRCAARLAAAA